MIGRWSSKDSHDVEEGPKGFDAFELRLGDVMRGERATMGKSLLDVQRELRIKASYIAAIENADPDAFDTPGFIAGYVRSYARYLNMDPDKAFEAFCAESGFEVAHGMSAQASVIKKPSFEERRKRPTEADLFTTPNMAFTPAGESFLSRIEPGAIGSMLVLIALIGGIGYGGYTVLQEVQRVQVAPVDETPVVLSDLDPLQGALTAGSDENAEFAAPRAVEAQRVEALDRLYRPQALDVPVLVSRDAPISTIDPRSLGNFAGPDNLATISNVSPSVPDGLPSVPQVVEPVVEGVQMIASSPSWVRVRSADGTIIFEATMNKGDTWTVPLTEEPPLLRTGNAGALYFAMGDGCVGPVGASGSIIDGVPLSQQVLAERYEPVDPNADQSLQRLFADLSETELAASPCAAN